LFRQTSESIVSELHSLYSHGKRSTFPARYSKERNASPISIICRKFSPSHSDSFVFLLMGSHRITGIFIYPYNSEDLGRGEIKARGLSSSNNVSEKVILRWIFWNF